VKFPYWVNGTGLLVGLWLSFLSLSWVEAQTLAPPELRLSVSPSRATWVGQAISLQLDILVPTWFIHGPSFSPPRLEGALTIALPGTTPISERRQGETWSGLRYRYLIVPLVAGRLELPPQTVDLVYAGANRRAHRATVLTPGVEIEALSPGVLDKPAQKTLATRELIMEQSFNRSLKNLLVGDVFVRKIRLVSPDLPAMLLPGLEEKTLEGIVTYRDTPRLQDHLGLRMGFEGGERHEQWTYVLTSAGQFQLPPIKIMWWNTETLHYEAAQFPTVILRVGVAQGGGFNRPRTLFILSLCLVLVLGIVVGFGRLSRSGLLRLVKAWWCKDVAACYDVLWQRHQCNNLPGSKMPPLIMALERELVQGASAKAFNWHLKVLVVFFFQLR